MTKLAATSCLLETELTAQLVTLAVSFEEEKYRFVYTAYEMLEKTGQVAEKLFSAFKVRIFYYFQKKNFFPGSHRNHYNCRNP